MLGMPLHVIVSEKNLARGVVEVKVRATGERTFVPEAELVQQLKQMLA